MLALLDSWRRGQRASDRGIQAPALPHRDKALERAIRRNEIELRFQPQIDARTGEITAVEALARWHDVNGPEELFGRAAKAGLSERLSRAIQRKALCSFAQWNGPLASLGLSINLLPEDLERPGFERWFIDEVADAGIDPTRITVEIVETSLVVDRPAVAARLSCMRAAGIRIAIDDFGTGYSCLAYLASLPIDAIKIDRAMIADLLGGRKDRIVVKAMISLAKELGLKVVVEGVENMAQLQLLAEWGCETYQGFLGSRPLDEVQLARFVAAGLQDAA